jgi:protease PrsW
VEAGRRQPRWRSVFLTGLVLWVASVLVTVLTSDTNLIPTVILLGSFLVPVTAVTWYLDKYESDVVTPSVVIRAFVVGGVLGLLAASLLEALLFGDGLLVYLGVGLIEEAAKLLGLLWVAWRLPHYRIRDGIVLGAAVGFGFAALESSGYALNALTVQQSGHFIGLSLPNMVVTELLRGILAPLGHGLWTAILGGVLFGAARGGRLRITGAVIGTYLFVSLLHALWDSMRGIALVLTELFGSTPIQQIAAVYGVLLPPRGGEIVAFTAFNWGGLALISAIGILVLLRLWRGAVPAGSRRSVAAPG